MNTASTRRLNPHFKSCGGENRREWLAPGGVPVVAVRTNAIWQLVEGPANLKGRHFRHIRDARDAVRATRTL